VGITTTGNLLERNHMNHQISPRAFAEEFNGSTGTSALDSMIRVAGSFAGELAIAATLAALFSR
jgi:hypothetical protein